MNSGHSVISAAVLEAIKSKRTRSHEDYCFYECGNIFVKPMPLPVKDTMVMSHSHDYDHLTLLARGSVLMTTEESEEIFTAPAVIEVKAGKHHGFMSLVDNTVLYCIHDKTKLGGGEFAG